MNNAIAVNSTVSATTLSAGSTVPVYQSISCMHQGYYRYKDRQNCRNNLRVITLETLLASLEKGSIGIAFGAGNGAIEAAIKLLGKGDEILAAGNIGEGQDRMITRKCSRSGIRIKYVDTSSLENIFKAVTANTKLLWLETPEKPALKISYIQTIAKLARAWGICFTWITVLYQPHCNNFSRWELIL